MTIHFQRYNLFQFILYQYRLRVSTELQMYIRKSLRDLLFLVVEFFIENITVQVVSTVKHYHFPLRDLFYEFLIKITSRKRICIIQYLSVEQLALVWIAFCFLNGSKGLTTIQKCARCLTIARALRICFFSMTILPSPKRRCNFTEPINPFKVHINGACNDLLYSGHVTIYTLTAISFTTLSRNYASKLLRYGLPFLIWSHMIHRIICTILERHHYSIDMFLGFVITSFIWHCKPLHVDLPEVPQNLFLHLKRIVSPRCHSTLKVV